MKRHILFPECWEEVTPKQYAWLLKYMSDGNKILTPDEIRIHFTDYLLGKRRPWNKLKRKSYFRLVGDLSESLDWMFRTEDQIILINYDTTQNLIPRIGRLLGPLSHGSDLKFGEYREAVAAYNDYTTTYQTCHLDRLVGILYRKKNKTSGYNSGNRRIPFCRYDIPKYIEGVKHVPNYLKWGVYLWFAAFCKYLLEGGLFIIDGKEISFSRIFRKGEQVTGTDIGMNSILFTMADAGTFGKVDETEDTELFRVLLKLLHDANMMDEIERRNKK